VTSPHPPPQERNRHGRARAMTVLTVIRLRYPPPGGVLWTTGLFAVLRTFPELTARQIRELSFIHFARWVVIRRLPDHDQSGERRGQPLFLFVSDYNGTFDQYVDAFAARLARGVQFFWAASYGIPGVAPVAPLKAYIRAHEYRANHYYSAYPTATTSMVRSAVALQELVESFTVRAATSQAPFGREYRKFLGEIQEYL
jgi:hypothetical protein